MAEQRLPFGHFLGQRGGHQRAASCVKLESQFLGEPYQIGRVAALVIGDAEDREFFTAEMLLVEANGNPAVFLRVAVAAEGMKVVAKDIYCWVLVLLAPSCYCRYSHSNS